MQTEAVMEGIRLKNAGKLTAKNRKAPKKELIFTIQQMASAW
jgi:hypothetical protein